MFVGVGSKKVRTMFEDARKHAPCVIFIDEIDAVGAKRVQSPYTRFANQTINQLLSEMDGFKPSEGIIVLGATNRKEDLDDALLRPGRFDATVSVLKPDVKGRREILKLYLDKVVVQEGDIDVDVWARRTIGCSGAELENLVNTAAIRAATLSRLRLLNSLALCVTYTDF